jgi:hypothetical protein
MTESGFGQQARQFPEYILMYMETFGRGPARPKMASDIVWPGKGIRRDRDERPAVSQQLASLGQQRPGAITGDMFQHITQQDHIECLPMARFQQVPGCRLPHLAGQPVRIEPPVRFFDGRKGQIDTGQAAIAGLGQGRQQRPGPAADLQNIRLFRPAA